MIPSLFQQATYSDIKEQLQPHILSNLLYFFRTEGIAARRYHSYRLLSTCYLTTSATMRFFYLSLFHWCTWSDPSCQGHCVCFTARIATLHYNKRPVVDSLNFEGYCVCLFEENHCSPAPCAIYSTERVTIIFVCTHPILSWWMC